MIGLHQGCLHGAFARMKAPMSQEPRILICSSMAFDTICVFPGKFACIIVGGDAIRSACRFWWRTCGASLVAARGQHRLHAEAARRCAGNLRGDWRRWCGYRERMAKLGIGPRCAARGARFVHGELPHHYRPRRQTRSPVFHAGAMFQSQVNDDDGGGQHCAGHRHRDGATACSRHARGFASKKIPFIFDPRSGDAGVLRRRDCRADRHGRLPERERLRSRDDCEKTGRAIESFAPGLNALIVTLGAAGLACIPDGRMVDVPVVPRARWWTRLVGDAFRAGFSTASRTAGRGRRAALATWWVRSRLPNAAGRSPQFTERLAIRARFEV